MTKSITLVALVCLLVVGAAATSILTRDSVPAAGIAMPAVIAKSPISNREAKGDRLTVNHVSASAERQGPAADIAEPVREALAYAPADAEMPMPTKPAATAAAAQAPTPTAEAVAPHPKPAAVKPEVQKAYALLSDGQIAGIKERLKLSASQEYYWPAVESALRAVAKKLHSTRQVASAKPGSVPAIDPDSDEVQQLKSAAMPLLWQLRDDQKDEVRKLARLIGLDKVAAAI
ncbi:hypothetical protein [Bradyrhizobium sp. STM 3557]|uniref:hypothetical protein n=1 Tax=Bradyrhizobium sp. STM 3557 TaxID=578920 RepID=UPI0038902D24